MEAFIRFIRNSHSQNITRAMRHAAQQAERPAPKAQQKLAKAQQKLKELWRETQTRLAAKGFSTNFSP
jgi:hypothetical protein